MMIWNVTPMWLREVYYWWLLLRLHYLNPEGERLLRFMLAKNKILRRRVNEGGQFGEIQSISRSAEDCHV